MKLVFGGTGGSASPAGLAKLLAKLQARTMRPGKASCYGEPASAQRSDFFGYLCFRENQETAALVVCSMHLARTGRPTKRCVINAVIVQVKYHFTSPVRRMNSSALGHIPCLKMPPD